MVFLLPSDLKTDSLAGNDQHKYWVTKQLILILKCTTNNSVSVVQWTPKLRFRSGLILALLNLAMLRAAE